VLLRERHRARLVEASGDDQHRVIGLVPGSVERLQLVDRHFLNVRALADDRIAVVVPRKGELLHALEEHAARVVFAHLELVSHHGHLAFEILLGHEGVHHAIGFHGDRPFQVVVGPGQGLEVVGAVVGGGAVPASAAARELLLQVRVALGALEEEMLQKMRHAFLTVTLVPRAHEVHDVHGDGVGAGVGQGKKLQAVRKLPLGNALDAVGLLRRLGRERRGSEEKKKER
jgi:hypothetical protein